KDRGNGSNDPCAKPETTMPSGDDAAARSASVAAAPARNGALKAATGCRIESRIPREPASLRRRLLWVIDLTLFLVITQHTTRMRSVMRRTSGDRMLPDPRSAASARSAVMRWLGRANCPRQEESTPSREGGHAAQSPMYSASLRQLRGRSRRARWSLDG